MLSNINSVVMKLFAKKSLGQHFLNSTHVLGQIIATAQIQTGETVLEIGPGKGVLTRALLTAGAKVVAVEKDVRAVTMLEQDFFADIQSGSLKIISGDILEMTDERLSSILNNHTSHSEHSEVRRTPIFAIVANIPYYITGAILEKFLEHGPRPDRMVILVQKEVADRIVAHDGKESILSVSVKAFGAPKIIAKVPPGAFTPPPTVDSAIIAITHISDKLFHKNSADGNKIPEKTIDISRFFSIVKSGFAHKRKFAIRNIESIINLELIQSIWEKLDLDPKVRAEDISVDQWVEIASTQ